MLSTFTSSTFKLYLKLLGLLAKLYILIKPFYDHNSMFFRNASIYKGHTYIIKD